MDYIQFFKDGWVVITGAPIQFVLIVLLSIVGSWTLIYRSFKGNLKLERELKDVYKEKLVLREADLVRLEESLSKERTSNGELQQALNGANGNVKRLNDGVDFIQSQLKERSAERDQLKAQLETTIADLARTKAEHVSFREIHLAFLNEHGRWRIAQLGMASQPAGLTVDIRYTEKDDDTTARNLRSFFWNEFASAWIAEEPKKIDWFKNPSYRARFVIFSNHQRAHALRASFNDCALLRIKEKDGEPTFRHESVDCSDQKLDWMTADFTIVIFDKPTIDEW